MMQFGKTKLQMYNLQGSDKDLLDYLLTPPAESEFNLFGQSDCILPRQENSLPWEAVSTIASPLFDSQSFLEDIPTQSNMETKAKPSDRATKREKEGKKSVKRKKEIVDPELALKRKKVILRLNHQV
jgi:hypothetical protein